LLLTDMPPAETPSTSPPDLSELFVAFVSVSLSGFGSALPWARRMIVERKGWMTADEFNEAFSLAQFLPGPNVVNFSVVFGSRFGGAPGAFVALMGLMVPPIVIVTCLAILYSYYGDVAAFGRVLAGVAAAAVGLLSATVAKMAMPLFRRGLILPPALAVVAFVAIGVLQFPLPWVIAVLAPVSIVIAWMQL
jgi:chromate transporter